MNPDLNQNHLSPKPAAGRRKRSGQSGFTLIEMIVVVTIIGILAGIAIVHVRYAQQKAVEAALRADLHEIRKAIDDFYADKQRYPSSLSELTPQYLRVIPKDPITNAVDWEEVQDTSSDPNGSPDQTAFAPGPADSGGSAGAPLGPGISDVKSKAVGQTLDHVDYNKL